MKAFLTLSFFATLLVAAQTSFALDIKDIEGNSANAIYDVLKNTLNAEETRNGDSPETACYDFNEVHLLGMRCETGVCYGDTANVPTRHSYCEFKNVASEKDFETIKAILKAAGLDHRNAIFRR